MKQKRIRIGRLDTAGGIAHEHAKVLKKLMRNLIDPALASRTPTVRDTARSLAACLGINPHHSSYRLLHEGRASGVNVLKKDQLDLAEHYGRPASADKLAGTEWTSCERHWLGSSAMRSHVQPSPRPSTTKTISPLGP